MKHQESDIKVYVSKKYDAFHVIEGNRSISEGKVKKMVRDITNGVDLLPDFPILTRSANGHLEVKDGQHRLEAAKRTNKPVYYIIGEDEADLAKIARMNSLQEKWKPADFLHCWIEKGVKDYVTLQEFQEDFNFPLGTSLSLLQHGITKDRGATDQLKEQFQRGEFRVKHLKQARDIAQACKRFGTSPYWNGRAFITAIISVLQADLIDFDELVKKFEADPAQLERHGNYKDYLVNLETIFNKGNHKRRTIF